jgi:trans-2-enoyl-CoA reductase
MTERFFISHEKFGTNVEYRTWQQVRKGNLKSLSRWGIALFFFLKFLGWHLVDYDQDVAVFQKTIDG